MKVKKILTSSPAALTAGLTFIVLASSAAIGWDSLRPYFKRSEGVELTATMERKYKSLHNQTCKNELSFYYQQQRDTRRQMATAEKEKNERWMRSLIEDNTDLLQEVNRVKKECGWTLKK